MMKLLVIFVVIISVCDQYIDCTTLCSDDSLDQFTNHTIYTGHSINTNGTSSQIQCMTDCNALHVKGFSVTRAVVMINDCLCIQNTTNVVPTSTATCLNVIASACDVLTTTCPVGPYSLADLNSGIISVAWTASDTMLLGQNWTVNIQTVPDSPTGVEYTLDVGDGYKKPMSKINVLQEDDIPAGYAIWKVTADVPSFSLPVENEQFVYISQNITAIHFTEYSVLETNIKHNIALNIAGGTNMSVNVMNGIEEETFVADVYESTIGSLYTTSTSTAPAYYGIYVIPSMMFTEDGAITKIHCKVARAGALNLFILRPTCSSGKFYSMTAHACTDNITMADGIDLVTSRKVTVTHTQAWSDPPTLKIVQSFIVELKSNDKETIALQQLALMVKRYDMIGFSQSPTSGQISFIDDDGNGRSIYFLSTDIGKYPGTEFINIPMNVEPKIPLMRIQYSKWFGHRMTVTPTTPGEHTIMANVQNSFSNGKVTVNKKYKVQDRITGLKLIEDHPKEATVSAYDIADETFKMKASVEKGTEVEYVFTISELQLQKVSLTGEAHFTINQTGIYTVEVEASNLVNKLNSSRQFSILSSIQGLYLMVSSKAIYRGNIVDFQVSVINGTNVTLELDYGDGTPPFRDTIGDARNGVSRSVSHNYTQCSLVTVKVKVQNNIAKGEWEIFQSPYNDTATIHVSCPFHDLKVQSDPLTSSLNDVELLLNTTLSLTIELVTGSFPVFVIDWGDGLTDTEDQSTNAVPLRFTKQHLYKANGTFNVTITVSNKLDSITKNLTVHTVKCASPKLLFEYGNENNRLIYYRKDKIRVTGTWTVPKSNHPMCTNIVAKKYKIKYWQVVRIDGATQTTIHTAETGFQPQYQRVIYEIASMHTTGNYNLVLTMEFDNNEYIYTGYFTIVPSALIAKIQNEQFQSIASKEKSSNGNITFYNFHLNASESIDPDDVTQGTFGLTFQWQCRLASNTTMVNQSLVTRGNTTTQFHCLNREWLEIFIKTDVDPAFNTKYFLENTEYEFRLSVTKGDRTSTANQIVYIAPGAPPRVDLLCIETSQNCGEKVNINDLVAFQLGECDKFPLNTLFSSVWEIKLGSNSDEDVIPPLKATGSCYRHNLIVTPNTLQASQNYTFTLKFRYLDSESTAVFKVKRTTSQTPYGGKCEIEGSKNLTAPSAITVLCSQWKSEDWPIEYQFYQTPKPNTKGPLREKTKNPTITFRPAVGDASRDHLNIITVVVLNRFKQFKEVNLNVYVRPTTESIDINSVLEKIPSDNPQEIANAAIMLTTATDSTSTRAAENGDSTSSSVEEEYGDIPVEKSAEQQQKEQEQRKEKEQKLESLANAIVYSIGNNTDTNIDALGASANAIEAISSSPDAVGGDTLDACTNAIDLISTRAAALFPSGEGVKNQNSIGREKIDEFANIMVNALSKSIQVVNSAAKVITEEVTGTSTTTEEQKQEDIKKADEKHIQRTASVRKGINTLAQALANNQISGEKQKQLQTKEVDMYVMKASSPNALSNTSFGNGNSSDSSGFFINNATNLFGDLGIGKPVSCIGVTYKSDIYPGINGSENIASNLPSLQFTSEGQELKVENASEPVIISIVNKPETLKPTNISMYLPGKFVFHAVQLHNPCNLLLNLKALNDFQNETTLHVYIQYGKAPSKTDHDIKLTLTQSTSITMTQNSGYFSFNNTTGNRNATNTTTEQVTLKRNSNVYLASDQTLVMWDFNNFTYGSIYSNSKLYLGLIYEGKMPALKLEDNPYTYDLLPFRGAYNFSLIAFCTRCSFVDTESGKDYLWSNRGCTLNPKETSLSKSVCECNHLTTFGSFFVAPNPLRPPSLALLKEGYVLLVTVATILLLYLVGLIFTRRADRADSTKIGVSPLPDNKPEDKHLYEITVNTGSRRNAGTQSNVFFQIGGDLEETGTRILKDTARRTFQRSSSDVFVMTTESSLGDLSYLRIWHDNKGGGWYLRSVDVIDLQTEQKFVFIASRWLAVDQYDGQVDVMLPLAGQLELKDFNYIFSSKTKRDLSDTHIWFSIYARPPRSPFTRCQRLSVAISLLFTGMTASCMFYGAIPDGDPSAENRIGNFSFKWQQVFVAIVSACITIPINVILVGLFRSIRPPKLLAPENDVNVSINEGFDKDVKDEDDEDEDEKFEVFDQHRLPPSPSNEQLIHNVVKRMDSTHINMKNSGTRKKKKSVVNGKKRKEPFYLPHWVLYPTWFLCICVILGSAFMVVWYGMNFGNKKSLDWLASVSISLVQDILLIQPLKVFLVALFVAVVVKKLDDEERSEVEKQVKSLAKNETWLHKFTKAGNIFDRADSEVFEPPKNEKLQQMKELRMKELKMKAISREIMLYLLFTFVVFLLGFMTRDYQSYHQTVDLEELLKLKVRTQLPKKFQIKFPFQKSITQHLAWDWIETMLLPELYPRKWYNLSDNIKNNSELYDFPGRIYLNDLSSKVVTGARLRQVRVTQNSCTKAKDIRSFISIDCLGGYSTYNELKRDFAHNWSIPRNYKIKMNPRDMPWRYQSWSDLDGYPFMAELDTYYGGGYVVELFPKWDNKKILNTLKEKKWLDRQTRAVLIEFSVYNGNTNYFDSIAIVFEFPPGGGVVHYHYVCTFKLYRYTNQYAFFTILCEVLFLLFVILFAVREARVMYRERWAYFTEFWNLVEFSNIILSAMAITFYFYRDVLAKNLLGRLPSKTPNVFINLQFAAYWDLLFTYIVALICFFVTLKFIKLLRFNRRISMLSSTLKRAWYPLLMFGILFGIVLVAVTISTTLIFGKDLYGYRDNFKSFSSIISLLLGKFSYQQFESTNPVLGPVFFFSFNVMVNWIIMNMYISILNDVLAEVQNDVKLQDNDYEMVDYMVNNFKGWFGLQNRSNEEMLQAAWQKNQEEDVANERKFSRLQSRRCCRSSRQQSRQSCRTFPSMTSLNKHSVGHSSDLSVTPEYSSYISSKVFNTDITFLTALDEDDMDEHLMNEILDKLVKCVSILNDGYKEKKRKTKKGTN